MKKLCLLLLSSMLGACGTYNAADTMAHSNDETKDMARCGGGLGIDNKVGLIIKTEAEKSGGELSTSQSSEIFAKAMKEGLVSSGDGKNYPTYVQCILELDKRRNDKTTSERTERIQQPALKVYLEPLGHDSQKRVSRRLVIENTGEELTELRVTPAPFLLVSDLCVIQELSDCANEKSLKKLQKAYIPIENYYSFVSSHGRYKGKLYSIDEANPVAFSDVVKEFTRDTQTSRTGSMNGQVITLVRVTYKDKFQSTHERFFDVSREQREMPTDLGQALFAVRMDWLKAGMAVDAAHASVTVLRGVWDKTRCSKAELPAPWLQHLALNDNA